MVLVALHNNNTRNGGSHGRVKKSLSVLRLVGLLTVLFLIAMLATIIYTQYVLIHITHSDIIMLNTEQQQQALFLSSKNYTTNDDNIVSCRNEYQRVMMHDRTTSSSRHTNLSIDDYDRSIAHVGNRYRLARVIEQKLFGSSPNNIKLVRNHKPLIIVVCGGSITLGHGITPTTLRYSDQLEAFLNAVYPTSNKRHTHKVYNRGSHGADMCAMAKRINFLDIPTTEPPDIIILEFAVNDYQGQDHKVHIDHKTDVFFDGFQTIAACAETVIYKLLVDYPNTAIILLEFQTAILNRKTAQLLHLGVAQHYSIPVISYADTLWPELYRLIDTLQPYQYSLPKRPASIVNEINAQFPYPHGCATCHAENIIEQFRDKGCKSICVFMERSGLYKLDGNTKCDADPNTEPCYVPFFAHDAVHPSVVGHRIARDLIVNLVATVQSDICKGRTFSPHHIPTHGGWLIAASHRDVSFGAELLARSNFVLVQDTMEVFAKQNPLLSNDHTTGFQLKPDDLGRKGWIATNPMGGESITFNIDLPVGKCYAVFLSVLKSYETVGTFAVTVEDLSKQSTTKIADVDCLWKPHISIPADVQITADDPTECTGKCRIIISTHTEIPNRGGNLIKIMSLSARECIVVSSTLKS